MNQAATAKFSLVMLNVRSSIYLSSNNDKGNHDYGGCPLNTNEEVLIRHNANDIKIEQENLPELIYSSCCRISAVNQLQEAEFAPASSLQQAIVFPGVEPEDILESISGNVIRIGTIKVPIDDSALP